MSNILDSIVAQKRLEIKALYNTHDLAVLQKNTLPTQRSFYGDLARVRSEGQPFFITEFKRKSPSEGWIAENADVPTQVRAYARAGASAISVLTDTPFFGGTYTDLKTAAECLQTLSADSNRPLLLQKDFVLDPIQIYLARQHGADLILLIAAILTPETLDTLRAVAESLGMGALVEVHDAEELDKVQHLDFPVLGVNNRDLKTFRTSLNRANVLARQAKGRFLIAESGVKDYRDFQVLRNADGFLIGTGLMQSGGGFLPKNNQPNTGSTALADYYKVKGKPLFKACGIRTLEHLHNGDADYIGINFSPMSKRRMALGLLKGHAIPPNAVAVFYRNTETEIRQILSDYPFKAVQVYANDVTPDFVRSLKKKVFLACPVRESKDLEQIEAFAADVDLFILDGAVPGSGQRIEAIIPTDFPYPFLLAGGLHEGNLTAMLACDQCIGVDVASGIEEDGAVSGEKIARIASRLLTGE